MPEPVFDPYANAPRLPFGRCARWLHDARVAWQRHWLFFLSMSLVVLALRWRLDGALVWSSYASDALLLSFVVAATDGADDSLQWRAAWHALRARFGAVLLSCLWAIPGIAGCYLVFSLSPLLVSAIQLWGNQTLLSLLLLTGILLVAGYLLFLGAVLPVLAGVHRLRESACTLAAAGLHGFRALRAGWRPLASLYALFLGACLGAALLLTFAYGHLPAGLLLGADLLSERAGFWYAWPGLFIAMSLFLALLSPLCNELLGAARVDLSDEIVAGSDAERLGRNFYADNLRVGGHLLRAASLLLLCVGVTELLFDLAWGDSIALAVVSFVWSGSFYRSARAVRENAGHFRRWRFLYRASWLAALVLWVLIQASEIAA